jgi:hypothetical protein
MTRLRPGPGALALTLVCALLGRAQAASPDACVRAYEGAQENRLEGRLRAAGENLLECAQATCPAFIRHDCTRWLEEVQTAQPTVVFVARREGRELDTVTITCNEQRVAERLDGRAIRLDPGKQSCRFEALASAPVTLALLVLEGQKNRIVEVDLAPRTDPPPPVASEPRHEPRSTLRPAPLVLAGAAVLGVAGFAALGASGLSAEHRLRDTCAPDCAASEVQSVRLRYRLADISLGVGLLSAAAASYLYWRSTPERPLDVAVNVGPAGGAVLVGSSF